MRGKGKFKREASEKADGRGEPVDRAPARSLSTYLLVSPSASTEL